jgi:hypothetical protein
MGIEESTWIHKVYKKITEITDANPIYYGRSNGINGKMKNESMEQKWYEFKNDMLKLMEKFYTYIPEPPEEARKPDRFDSSETVRREKRTFSDTWRWKGISEEITMTLIIQVNKMYEKYYDFVCSVDSKPDYYELGSLLDQLRPLYKERESRFKKYQEMMKVGGPEEWTKLEKKKREEKETAERVRREKEMEEEAIARDKLEREIERSRVIHQLIVDRRDLEEKLRLIEKKFYSGEGDYRDLIEEENKIKSALRDVERREEDLLKKDPEGYNQVADKKKGKDNEHRRHKWSGQLSILLHQLQILSS